MVIAEQITILFATFNAGIVVGTFIHKRKRDKEFSRIVAERLLPKTQVQPLDNSQANWANANMQQVLSGLGGSLGASQGKVSSEVLKSSGFDTML